MDGIPYCTIKTFGEEVFAVEPMEDHRKHAFPVAESFENFAPTDACDTKRTLSRLTLKVVSNTMNSSRIKVQRLSGQRPARDWERV